MTEERVNRTLSRLFEAAQAAGMFVTGDDRVSEVDAARLLGFSGGYLAQLREESKGPSVYHRGAGGQSRKSYRLEDLAVWIEAGFEEKKFQPTPANPSQRNGAKRGRRRA